MILKKWVNNLLLVLSFLVVFIAVADTNNDKVFLIKGIICLFILLINGCILIIYGRN